MAECCIVGCFNRPEKRGALKFYRLPTSTSTRPSKVKRRRLWLEAIEKANGSSAGLSPDAQICSAHFVSGQVSLDVSNPDFVPSVFPTSKPYEGIRRASLRPRAQAAEAPLVSPKKKTERKQAPKQLHQPTNTEFTNIDCCKPLEDEEVLEDKEKEKIQISSEVVKTELPQHKKPSLLLKSIVDSSGRFRCDVCNSKFSDGSGLVKHKQRHDQERSDEETLLTVTEDCENAELTNKRIHNEEPSFKCNMCDRSFPTIHNLKRHKLLHVRDTRKCMQCGILFCKRHTHVVVQPQISTEATFEEVPKTADTINVSAESQIPETCEDKNENDDDILDFLLNSDSQTLETTSSEQEQSETHTETQSKPVPVVTCSPRKPDLLTAFRSFINKENTTKAKSVTSYQTVESTPPAPSCSTDLSAAQPDPQPAANAETSSSSFTAKPVLIIKSLKPQPGQPHQKVERSTICLSFSKPLPPHVLKEFVSFISKNECSKSTIPRVITFTAKPTSAAQEPPTDQSSTVLNLDPVTDPVDLPTLPKPESTADLVSAPNKTEANVIPIQPKPLLPPTLKTPKKHPPLESEYVHGSRPPSPVPIVVKRRKGPWDSPAPKYHKYFVQPHLPQPSVHSPSLQMFSPQCLTSAAIDVKRNYEYILSKGT